MPDNSNNNNAGEKRSERLKEASRAMEGEELRQRREVREGLAARRAAERESAALASEAAKEAERQKIEAEEAQQAARAEEAEAAYKGRVDKISTANQTIESLKNEKVMMSPLRTYKGDLARVVKEEGVSLSTIALSEQTRKRFGLDPAAAMEPKKKSYLLYLILGLVVILAGGGIFIWWQATAITPVPTGPDKPNLITSILFSEQTQEVALASTPANTRAALNLAAKNLDGNWSVKNISFTQGGAAANWNLVAQNLKLQIPDVLAKSLSPRYMLGFYRSGNLIQRFLILKTSSIDRAFAGMIAWEQTLGPEVLPLFYEIPPLIPMNSFKDKLVRNRDTRVLMVENKSTVLLYSLVDNETIVLAPNEEVFTAVLDRLTSDETPGIK